MARRGPREAFKVELEPDFDQKRAWKRLQEDAAKVVKAVRRDLETQMKSLKFLVAKNLFLEGRSGEEERGSLDDFSLARLREWAYDSFDPSAPAGRAKNVKAPIQLKVEDVTFSLSDDRVRIPYLGLTRYRYNQRIVPSGGTDSENKQWLLANIRSFFLRELNYALCLVVDTSETGTTLGESKRQTTRRRSSKWLD